MSILINLFLAILALFAFGLLIIFLWFFRYRFMLTVTLGHTPNMSAQIPEGFSDKMAYTESDSALFFLRTAHDDNSLVIRKMTAPYQTETIQTIPVGLLPQVLNQKQSETGCVWNSPVEIGLENFTAGYYRADLIDKISQKLFPVFFTVGRKKPVAPVAILSPVGTWTAYNAWGGKSLYQNSIDRKNTHFVSTQRPITSLKYDKEVRAGDEHAHDISVEANIFHWFDSQFGADIFPDYVLEAKPELLENAKIIVLSYHCEYVSSAMYRTLENLVHRRGKSLISLGANQLYWKVQWHDNFTRMECHKDMTLFDDFAFGGMWRHNFKPMQKLQGIRYDNSGLHSFAPYEVMNDSHPLFHGLGVKNGQLFGKSGINVAGLSGNETDKITKRSAREWEILAKGQNWSKEAGMWEENNAEWDGAGGGDMVFREFSKNNAVLSTGSIQSGSGLGTDEIFTGIIRNFGNQYLK